MANLGFEVEVDKEAAGYRSGFEIIPPGWYTVVIVGSLLKPTSSGNGTMLELKLELQDGTRRTVIDRINIINPSEKAQAIGRSTLAKIAQSIGHKGTLTNTDVLHGRTFSARIAVEQFESNKEAGKMLDSNEVVEYRTVGASASAAALIPSTAPAPTVPSNVKPW